MVRPAFPSMVLADVRLVGSGRMSNFRVWPKDEFDGYDADEREDSAMQLKHEPGDFSLRRVGRTLHHPYSVDDAADAAEVYADYFHSNRDGWECTWPIEFVVHDGERYFIVEVDRDFDPTFSGSKPKPFEVQP